jgi:hypothetical protein
MGVHVGFVVNALATAVRTSLRRLRRRLRKPTHVLFCMVDHFEPGVGKASAEVQRARMAELLGQYPSLADAHRDAYGRRAQRTWFFPPHYHDHGNLRDLVRLCQQGYGEIELHLHHGKTQPDTAENLERTIRLCLQEYRQFGIFGSQDGRTRYGFIHGDWALSNSREDNKYCGVDEELQVLQRTGCYADLTFPSCCQCNPTQLNSIFYADTNRRGGTAHRRGQIVRVGGVPPPGGLMMIQGPVWPVLIEGRPTFGDTLNDLRPLTSKLIHAWLRARIHVAGRGDWIVLKAHTHGANNPRGVLGPLMDQGFRALEEVCNDRDGLRLHYVTARELYNILKAAEAGRLGDPDEYRDYIVAAPNYDARPNIPAASPELREAVGKTYCE